jgi:hypothetical protein
MKKNGIKGKVGYPAEAVHWHIDAEQRSHPSAVFRSIICTEGLKVLLEHDAGSTDVELCPDSIAGEPLLWSEPGLSFRQGQRSPCRSLTRGMIIFDAGSRGRSERVDSLAHHARLATPATTGQFGLRLPICGA